MSLENVRTVFADAARELGLSAGSALDENGACTIVSNVRGMPEICFAYDAEGDCADLFAEIAEIPADRADLLRDFLCDNLFGRETRGASFALLRERNLLVLNRVIEMKVVTDGPRLAAILSDFAEVAYRAKQRVFAPAAAEPKLGADGFAIQV